MQRRDLASCNLTVDPPANKCSKEDLEKHSSIERSANNLWYCQLDA
jgi:hypothetical protein